MSLKNNSLWQRILNNLPESWTESEKVTEKLQGERQHYDNKIDKRDIIGKRKKKQTDADSMAAKERTVDTKKEKEEKKKFPKFVFKRNRKTNLKTNIQTREHEQNRGPER